MTNRRSFIKGSLAGAATLVLAPEFQAYAAPAADFFKKTRVAGEYDVVVCGGGPAGFIAATAAARGGAKTALIERYGFLGGMATAGYVAPLSVFAFKGELVIGGIPWEFIKRLESMGGAFVEMPKGNVDFDIELYKLCVQRMVLEAGVDLYTHSYIAGLRKQGNRITHAIISNKNGFESIAGKVFIDATGDADLGNMAGVPMQANPEGELQPSSFCFVLSGVDTSTEMMQKHMHHNGLNGHSQVTAVREKFLALKDAGADIPNFGGPWFNSVLHDGSVAVNITRAEADSCDNRNFSAAECRMREDIFRFTELLRQNFAEFRNCYVSSTAPQAGVRESRRILGAHTVTAEEYLSGIRYDDSISRGAHPIDMHSSKGTAQRRDDLQHAAYVPYRALYNPDFPNYLAAGRCISTDRIALASIRVQGSCMGLGQAAGTAAAMCVAGDGDVRKVDTAALVASLKAMGAIL